MMVLVTSVGVALAASVAIARPAARGPQACERAHRDAGALLEQVEVFDLVAGTRAQQREVNACYRAYVVVWEECGVKQRMIDAEAPHARPRDLEALWGYARCTDGSARLLADAEAQRDRGLEAAFAYARYADLERRRGIAFTNRVLIAQTNADLIPKEGVLVAADRVASVAPMPRVMQETRRATSLAESIRDAFTDYDAHRFAQCYAAFVALAGTQDLEGKLEEIATARRKELDVSERDILLGRARCAYALIGAGGDDDPPRILDAAQSYEAYASVERRMERASAVREATELGDALFNRYYAAVERQALAEHPQPEAVPRRPERAPVLGPVAEAPRARFLHRLAAANGFLQLKLVRRGYALFHDLAREDFGRDHPDVAYGLAQSAELTCATIDDDVLRLTRLTEARDAYERYLTIETRSVHHLATGHVPEARRVLRELTERIRALGAKLAQAIRDREERERQERERAAQNALLAANRTPAPSVPDAEVPPPPGGGRGTGGDDVGSTAGGDDEEEAARDAVEARDPLLAAQIAAQPGYTWQSILCFIEHGMAPRTLTEVDGAIRFVYDLPPPDTPCPPPRTARR